VSEDAVRLAGSGDLPAIVALCDQLGYPAVEEQVRQRLQQIEQNEDHAVYVVERPGVGVVGWVHVYVRPMLIVGDQAEIGGLVVDESCRRSGVGLLLLARAERWARERDHSGITVRSNAVREGAHAFYRDAGYGEVKVQRVFRKAW